MITVPDLSWIDTERAKEYGRQDYWNSQGWREELANNRADDDNGQWLEEHRREIEKRFFTALREKAPGLFTGKTITIPMLKKQELALKESALSVGCSPDHLRSVDWWSADVRISKGAERHFDLFALHLKDEYDGPDWLPLPRRRPIQESIPELFGDNAITFNSNKELGRYIWERADK